MCPVCTIAVAGGLGLSRWLGIDDTITGIWIGGLLISSSLWTSDWIKKNNKLSNTRWVKSFGKYLDYIISVVFYLLVFVPLSYKEIIGHPFNKIFGVDKLMLGTTLGTLGFLFAVYLDKKVRKIKGNQLFNYQKVVFPILFLCIISLIIYLLVM